MIKKIIKKAKNYLKENAQLNKDASAEYNRRMGGPTSDSPYHMRGVMEVKKELKKKRSKIEKYY